MKINGKDTKEIRAESEEQISRLELEIEQLQYSIKLKKETLQQVIRKIKNIDTLENIERDTINVGGQ